MKKKLILTESQLKMLTKVITENGYSKKVGEVHDYLKNNYEATVGIQKEGGEYFNKGMVLNKVDGEMITPKSLFDHIKYKFPYNPEFLEQVIRDWYDNKIDSKKILSRNVTP